jgi:hypothetical protein
LISGDNREDRSDLTRLTQAMAAPPEKRFAELSKVIDMDRVIRMIAMEVILNHWDGYALHRNNYRLYHDMDKDRFMLIPHGMDEALGGMIKAPDRTLYPYFRGRLAVAIRSTEEGKSRYAELARDLVKNSYDFRSLTNRVNELSACVRGAVVERTLGRAPFYDQAVEELKATIAARGAYRQQQVLE